MKYETDLEKIIIRGASEHNLKHINLEIPRRKFVVITGVSGSGKSSLAFDTLFSEGQRRYVESLSAYARQFLGRLGKPKVEFISGLSPTISIEQKSSGHNPRSTVGTVTEIYDHLRVLFARTGVQYCPYCEIPITSQSSQQMVESILCYPEGTRIMIAAPVVQNRKGEHSEVIETARRQGFVRIRIDGKLLDLDDEIRVSKSKKHNIDIIVDRLIIRPGIRSRLADSVEIALKLTDGLLKVVVISGEETLYSANAACLKCGRSFPALTPQTFSFNSPQGMCPHCKGLGTVIQPDENLLITNPDLSIRDGVLASYATEINQTVRNLKYILKYFKIPDTVPWKKIPGEIRFLILNGYEPSRWQTDKQLPGYIKMWTGFLPDIHRLYLATRSESMRRFYSKFIRNVVCPECSGLRLNSAARAVRFHGKTITQITGQSVKWIISWMDGLELGNTEKVIARELFSEIRKRLMFLNDVGLHYLTLDRRAPTLSGGESQRIRLASQIGSGLMGVMYVLDEPSIGLHAKDTSRLLSTLKSLRDRGNTVIVVEHDPETIREADFIVDMGPGAGHEGGEVVATGTLQEIMADPGSLTGKYLSGQLHIGVPKKRRKKRAGTVWVRGATENNLKNIDVRFPLSRFICVTGVSGSGKSTLVNMILFRGLAAKLNRSLRRVGAHKEITGAEKINRLIEITQKPIGRTPRSNPATYTGLFTPIRNLFAALPESKLRGYQAGRFSFNVPEGRCQACDGDGVKRIQMHFLPDVFVTCEVCGGKRFNTETLDVTYRGLNIADVLDLEVRDAINIFSKVPGIVKVLQTLMDVGLDYIKLGQPAPTLSGGEAQRVKLSRELSKNATGRTLYVLDEPTTGLHPHDIRKLLSVLHRLVDRGNTVVVIEHNMDVIKNADWVIDLGPEGGDEGGWIVAAGTPEEIAKCEQSYTGRYLRGALSL